MRLGKKRMLNGKNRNQFFGVFTFALVTFVLTAILCYILAVVRPTFVAVAENQAKMLAVHTINEAISEKLNHQPVYDDIVQLERNENSSVTALKSNLSGISKLKSELNLEIQNKIAQMDTSTLKIPLGSLLGSDIFAGLGPKISFQVMPYGAATTDVETNFKEAGINQTILDVTVKVKADLSILMPTIRKKSTVETSVPIIQTIIVGNTPNTYTHIDRDGYQYEDDVMELLD